MPPPPPSSSNDLEMVERLNPDPPVVKRSRRRCTCRRFLNALVVATVPELRRQQRRVKVDVPDARFALWNDEDADPKSDRKFYNCCPPPIFIPIMAVAHIAIFAFYAVRLNDVKVDRGGVDFKSPLIYDPTKRHEAWRFLSYSLLHYGIFHLATNTLLLLTLGCILELQHKFWRVAPIYILGVVAGSLASSVFDAYVFLVGASGGAYALLGGHLATVLINWKEMQHRWSKSCVNCCSSGVCRVVAILVLVAGDTGVAVYTRYSVVSNDRTISYAAHIASFVAGALTGVIFLRNFRIRKWERVLCIVCICLYIISITGGVIFNILCAEADLCPYPNIN